MKRILLSLLLVGVVLALSSCNVMLGWILADKMTLDGEDEYELAEMYLDYYGDADGYHYFELVLVSDGIDWGEITISGTGDFILVGLASPDRDLADGTYEYDSTSPYDDFDMLGALVVLVLGVGIGRLRIYGMLLVADGVVGPHRIIDRAR